MVFGDKRELGLKTHWKNHLDLSTNELSVLLSRERLGSLNGGSNSTVNNELRKDTNGTGNTKENSVVLLLSETIVLEKDTRVGVHIRPRVLGLTVLGEDTRSNLVDGGNKVEEIVVRHVLKSKLTLSSVSRVSLSEDSVTVTGNNTTSVKSVPEVLLNDLRGNLVTNRVLHLKNPLKDLLVGTAVERAGKTVETSGKRKEGGREGRANKLGGVGRDVTTLVVSVDGEVKTEKLNKLLRVTETKLGSKVLRVIGRSVGGAELTILEAVSVDAGSNGRELGNEVDRVFISVGPVLLLVDTSLVSLGERRLRLESVDSNGELSHGVEGGWGSVNEVLDVLGELRAGVELSRESLDLSGGGDLTSQKKPEETFGKGFFTALGLGELLLEIRDGSTSESDTLIRVKDGTLPNEGLDTTHTTVNLVEKDLTDNSVTVFLSQLFDLFNLLRKKFSEALLKSL